MISSPRRYAISRRSRWYRELWRLVPRSIERSRGTTLAIRQLALYILVLSYELVDLNS